MTNIEVPEIRTLGSSEKTSEANIFSSSSNPEISSSSNIYIKKVTIPKNNHDSQTIIKPAHSITDNQVNSEKFYKSSLKKQSKYATNMHVMVDESKSMHNREFKKHVDMAHHRESPTSLQNSVVYRNSTYDPKSYPKMRGSSKMISHKQQSFTNPPRSNKNVVRYDLSKKEMNSEKKFSFGLSEKSRYIHMNS